MRCLLSCISLPQSGNLLGFQQRTQQVSDLSRFKSARKGAWAVFLRISGGGAMSVALLLPPPPKRHAALFCFNKWPLVKTMPLTSRFLPNLATFLIKRGCCVCEHEFLICLGRPEAVRVLKCSYNGWLQLRMCLVCLVCPGVSHPRQVCVTSGVGFNLKC